MLTRLSNTAAGLGLEIDTVATEAEYLPFEDESFDLVFGHAVLHHIPDLERAFSEFRRVLRPGGVIAFAGEPSRYGDRLAAVPKRAGMLVAPAWRELVRARRRAVPEAEQSNGHALESEVDVHAFAPADLRRLLAATGFEDRRVGGEELLANAWGWGLRTVESSAEPESVSWRWRKLRLPQLHRPAEGRHPSARAAPPRRALLQPARLRPQAGLAAGAEELDPGVDALEAALAGGGVGEVLAGRLPDRGVDEDAARPGDAGDPARQVDRTAVVVA